MDEEPQTTEQNEEKTARTEDTNPYKKAPRWEVYFPPSKLENRDAIHVASFPIIIYFWPAMACFLLCGVFQWSELIAPSILGWTSIVMFGLCILVVVEDFDQKKFLILVLALVVLGMGAWIINMKGFQFLKSYSGWLASLEPTFSTSAFFILGFLLLFFMAWGMIRPFFNYWRIEHNEFVHYNQPFGRDMSIPRSGSTVSKDVPDILEFVLTFGGGSLIIKREGQVWATIPHIPLLGLRMKAIEKMLSETRVTSYPEG